MVDVTLRKLYEAVELVEEVISWSEEEVQDLPPLYREKAMEIKRLAQKGPD